MITLFDTHCHTVDGAFLVRGRIRSAERPEAADWGLTDALLLATHADDFSLVRQNAHALGVHYGLGVHPLLVKSASEVITQIERFEQALCESLPDCRLAAVGEIGIDAYPGASRLPLSDQIRLFEAMLAAARDAHLPVSIHCRKALSAVFASLKRTPVPGVLHAFAGSLQEARQALKLGMKLGFGPSLTYEGSKRIRAVFAALPEEAFVLETDAPYMPTARARRAGRLEGKTQDILQVLQAAAALRGLSRQELAAASVRNARAVFAKAAVGTPADNDRRA